MIRSDVLTQFISNMRNNTDVYPRILSLDLSKTKHLLFRMIEFVHCLLIDNTIKYRCVLKELAETVNLRRELLDLLLRTCVTHKLIRLETLKHNGEYIIHVLQHDLIRKLYLITVSEKFTIQVRLENIKDILVLETELKTNKTN